MADTRPPRSSGRARRLLAQRTVRLFLEIRDFARGRLLAVMALSSAAALAEGFGILMLVPVLSRLGVDGGAPPYPGLELALALYALLAVGAALVVAAREVAARRLTLEFVDHLRQQLHAAVLDLGWRSFTRLRSADLGYSLTHDVHAADTGVEFLLGLGGQLVQLAAAGVVLAVLSPTLALASAVTGLVLVRLANRLDRHVYGLAQRTGNAWQRLSGMLANDLAAFRVLKSFGGGAARRRAFAFALDDLRSHDLAVRRTLAGGSLAARILGAVGAALAVLVAARGLHLAATETLAILVAEARLIQGTGRLLASWRAVVHALPAHARVGALLLRCRRAAEPEEGTALPAAMAAGPVELRLEAVTVQWASDRPPALDNVSLTLPAGAMVAVTGPSGAGKSTLGDVLLGLIAPDRGRILLNGVELPAAQRPAWRRRTSVLPQDPLLFEDTVAANLRLAAPEAGDPAIYRALADAGADFVAMLPDGLAAQIGERGVALSGGERQRLALARALLRHPALLVLDEPTNSLDAGSEARLLASLEALRGSMTIVLITHRQDIAARADVVVHLDQGRQVQG